MQPQQLTQLAKPLQKQTFDKTRVWIGVVGGAAVLFVVTLVLENNEAWFPAIRRANKAMEMSREAAKVCRWCAS